MCGIFGLLCSPRVRAQAPGESFFRALEQLTLSENRASASRLQGLPEGARTTVLELLSRLQGESYRWVSREGFLAALQDDKLQGRLQQSVRELERWVTGLERSLEGASIGRQRDWEFINALVVGGKDVLWRLQHDLLENFSPVRSLLGGETTADVSTLGHAWQLNMILRSLDRLEVRGRDSAGIAVYLRFPERRDLESFLAANDREGEELCRRSSLPALSHGTMVRPASSDSTLLVVFKVASEVGRMGDNVAFLREAISGDRLFQAALRTPGLSSQCLAHTRWASNGVISLANCHPVDGALFESGSASPRDQGELIGVLNGDVDNYMDLLERYVHGGGRKLDPAITTDAKIIPVVVEAHYRQCGDFPEAFRRAFAEFEGSMAIGLMRADRPGEFLFGQKGSGQGLFLGMTPDVIAIASEMYGLVELTPCYVKAEGERLAGGEVFHLQSGSGELRVETVDDAGPAALPPARCRIAEITTRDINRGDKPHFFLKEIFESVDSVWKTFRGKFDTTGGGVRFLPGKEVLGDELVEGLRAGRVRKIYCVGQGTAAVAAGGIAHLLERALVRADHPLQVAGLKATELSGHWLSDDMSDTLVVAVSQSGTTTDTNRTVDMARERGARIVGIVNRRNSDLVYKSHGVLYTSDGRDIEMSVASTKAFYSQNVAGQVLALALACELGTLEADEILAGLRELERLPDAMRRTLALEDEVARAARRFAVRRRHWAVVGSGAGKIAADEIRIKLSELCYKSIAVDFLEDKKHIDLSSEPFVLVCASGVPPSTVSDLVKEVAIFKAHKSLPVVITDEGESRFDPYAAETLRVPRDAGRLAYLLATIVGHLLGYHAAAALDRAADCLRRIRAEFQALCEAHEEPLRAARESTALSKLVLEAQKMLLSGEVDAGMGAAVTTRLYRTLEVLSGRLPREVLDAPPPEGIMKGLTGAVTELSRPIDAIKHQAKTVTVGISRGEPPAGSLSPDDSGRAHSRSAGSPLT